MIGKPKSIKRYIFLIVILICGMLFSSGVKMIAKTIRYNHSYTIEDIFNSTRDHTATSDDVQIANVLVGIGRENIYIKPECWETVYEGVLTTLSMQEYHERDHNDVDDIDFDEDAPLYFSIVCFGMESISIYIEKDRTVVYADRCCYIAQPSRIYDDLLTLFTQYSTPRPIDHDPAVFFPAFDYFEK